MYPDARWTWKTTLPTTIIPPTPPTVPQSGPTQAPKPRRYHGTVILDSARVGRDASRVAEEVITHLNGLVGSSVRVILEIEAEIPEGAPDNVVRTLELRYLEGEGEI
jgi:hypothetical protein